MVKPSALKDCSGHRVNMITAKLARIERLTLNSIVLSNLLAFRAKNAIRKPFLEQPFKTSIVIREVPIEVFCAILFHMGFHWRYLFSDLVM